MRIDGILGYDPSSLVKAATETKKPAEGGGFADKLNDAIEGVSDAQNYADDRLSALASGDDVDLHGTMIAMEEAHITLRTMVTARDKVVEAYQQVMNMQI